ncbi:sulfotransferase [Nocardiopsis sp. NRRL B-16309]|uniref:sulfotransferase family protein n=1 Tax=Nocardiopsis sp. NRRL B-16309 TaxID=1519494 RepID=UPI000B0B5370|nr:sulfotransferase [Nocardiopsis sp. NRRL B-16309]
MNARPAWWVAPANTLLTPATRSRFRDPARAFEAAERAAADRSGLPWPRDREFRSRMRFLSDAWLSAPGVTPLGRLSVQNEVERRLETRLRLLHLFEARPEVADQVVDRPVFITGLPRTGTTFAHGLLAQHARTRAPALWELLDPVPPSGREGERVRDRRERLASARSVIRFLNAMAPRWQSIHPMHPLEPEECVFLLPHSMAHHVRIPVPEYRAWMEERDTTPDYEFLKAALQAMQLDHATAAGRRPPASAAGRGAPRRWVLKSPLHLGSLDALLRVFPDATVVLTDRDPVRATASWGSLVEAGMALHLDRVDPHWIGEEWLGIWTRSMARAERVRAASAPGTFVDLPYDELTADPVGVAERVWTGLGEEFDDLSRRRTTDYTRRDRRPSPHRYTIDRYGLTPERVLAAFGG